MTSVPMMQASQHAEHAAEAVGVPAAEGVTLAYDQHVVSSALDLTLPESGFTVIIGPNGCGKSTLLRAFARLLQPQAGRILIDGKDVRGLRGKDLARKIGFQPQSAIAPDGITVFDLVARGRYPHQSLVSRWSKADAESVHMALAATGMDEHASRPVAELSGGQSQRAWVAMALAQESPCLLLDEPTTFLDMAYQVQLLNLFADLNRVLGRTIIAVLHDVNHAARYAENLVVMNNGDVVAAGPPGEVLTSQLLLEVFGVQATIIEDPVNSGPLVVTHHSAGGGIFPSGTSQPAGISE